MALSDDINRLLRDHVGYSGDGQGGNGALPVGDRSTARKPVTNRDLREILQAIAGEDPGDPRNLSYRPGDTPGGFVMGTAAPGASAFGMAAFSEGATRITGAYVSIEPNTVLEFRASFFRTVNSPDPDNDAVRVGIEWLNASKGIISQQTILTRTGLTVADGRIEALRIASADAEAGQPLFVIPPAGAVYGRAWVQFFGSGHRTGCDLLMLRPINSWVKEAARVRAEGVFTPDGDFEWPENWIPETRIERAYTPDPAFEFPSAWIPGEVITGTIFVDYDGGQDAGRDGRSWKNRVKTLERAAELATLYASEGQNGGQWTVVMSSTTHYTNGELAMPDNCYVRGMGTPRSTTVRPNAGYEVSNVFLMGSGGHAESFNTRGWRIDDLANATKGFTVALRPGALFTRAIWIDRVISFRDAPAGIIPRGLNRSLGNPGIGPGSGVAICDPMVASQYSPMPQIMVSSATLVSPNGIGLRAVNGGYINCLYMVPLWAHVGFEAVNGGVMDLTYCSLQFGDYCLRREGSRQVANPRRSTVIPTPSEAGANAIVAAKTSIVNTMWSALVAAGYGSLNQAATRTDAGLFVDAMANSIRAGDEDPIRWFARRMFKFDGTPVTTPSSRPGFILAWQNMRNSINALGPVAGNSAAVTALTQLVVDTVTSPIMRTAASELNANDFVFRKVGTGVDFGAIERDPLPILDTFIDRGPGGINWNGVDQDTGRQFFTGGALVNPLTGQLEGPPIDRTIRPRARRIARKIGGFS